MDDVSDIKGAISYCHFDCMNSIISASNLNWYIQVGVPNL